MPRSFLRSLRVSPQRATLSDRSLDTLERHALETRDMYKRSTLLIETSELLGLIAAARELERLKAEAAELRAALADANEEASQRRTAQMMLETDVHHHRSNYRELKENEVRLLERNDGQAETIARMQAELHAAREENADLWRNLAAFEARDERLATLLDGQPESKQPAGLDSRVVQYVERLRSEAAVAKTVAAELLKRIGLLDTEATELSDARYRAQRAAETYEAHNNQLRSEQMAAWNETGSDPFAKDGPPLWRAVRDLRSELHATKQELESRDSAFVMMLQIHEVLAPYRLTTLESYLDAAHRVDSELRAARERIVDLARLGNTIVRISEPAMSENDYWCEEAERWHALSPTPECEEP
jgi:chromosome segregation ATPase